MRDDQREKIETLLPVRKDTVDVTVKNNRLLVVSLLASICHRARIPWRELPERFGDFPIIHTRWSKRGLWPTILTINTP